jgi:hypothetical protein
VARLTAVLEGPGSPIDTILAQGAPERSQARSTPDDSKGTLADRIRALQTTASRAAS